MSKFYMIIRKITVAPVLAAFTVIALALFAENVFSSVWEVFLCVFFLSIVPLLAYPLQPFIPGFKSRGREGQRFLAMIFAVLGYVLGIAVNIFSKMSDAWDIIFFEYFISGMLILIFNKLFHLKISGHACGVFGSVSLLSYFGLFAFAAFGVILAAVVLVSSLKTSRHTLPQFIGGSIVPVVSMFVVGSFFA